MVTNIKMKVNNELSNRVQEICFGEKIFWDDGSKTLKEYNDGYLYIASDCIFKLEDYNLDLSIFKEISALDFIMTMGEREWIPNYKELALFSDDNEKWEKGVYFRYDYGPYPYLTNKKAYKYCKEIKKLVFTDFLKENNLYSAYMDSVKIENQRWDSISKYKNLSDIKQLSPNNWILESFNWEKQGSTKDAWSKLYFKWDKILKEVEEYIDVVFEDTKV